MKNRMLETYNMLWSILRRGGILGNEPSYIKTDFEFASISAIRANLTQTNVSGCLFHLSQAIIRKIQNMGPMGVYKTNRQTRRSTKYLVCLSFIQTRYIERVFFELRSSQNFPPALILIYDYFYSTYINPERAGFPTSSWVIPDIYNFSLPRTNSATEGRHRVFKDFFGNSIYSFVNLINQWNCEEENVWLKKERLDGGEELRRNQIYLRLSADLINYIEENGN